MEAKGYRVSTGAMFATTGGSHMWRMETPESDVDILEVYNTRTEDILRGVPVQKTKPTWKGTIDGTEYDVDFMEIGHLVQLLIKGNCNAIWAVTSPLIRKNSPALQELRKLVWENRSKNIFQSIKGMAKSQIDDATKREAVRDKNKSLATAMRTIGFGTAYLSTGTIAFQPVEYKEYTEQEVAQALDTLNWAFDASPLPTEPDDTKYRDFIYGVRLMNWGGLSI